MAVRQSPTDDLAAVMVALVSGLIHELAAEGVVKLGSLRRLALLAIERLTPTEEAESPYQLRLPLALGGVVTPDGEPQVVQTSYGRKGGVNDVQSP